jgi:hypothetical protein
VLDKRSVTTLMGTTLVVWTLPTDGGGTNTGDGIQNGFATQAVAMLQGKPIANALPNDGKFPASRFRRRRTRSSSSSSTAPRAGRRSRSR